MSAPERALAVGRVAAAEARQSRGLGAWSR